MYLPGRLHMFSSEIMSETLPEAAAKLYKVYAAITP